MCLKERELTSYWGKVNKPSFTYLFSSNCLFFFCINLFLYLFSKSDSRQIFKNKYTWNDNRIIKGKNENSIDKFIWEYWEQEWNWEIWGYNEWVSNCILTRFQEVFLKLRHVCTQIFIVALLVISTVTWQYTLQWMNEWLNCGTPIIGNTFHQ